MRYPVLTIGALGLGLDVGQNVLDVAQETLFPPVAPPTIDPGPAVAPALPPVIELGPNPPESSTPSWVLPVAIVGGVAILGGIAYVMLKRRRR